MDENEPNLDEMYDPEVSNIAFLSFDWSRKTTKRIKYLFLFNI